MAPPRSSTRPPGESGSDLEIDDGRRDDGGVAPLIAVPAELHSIASPLRPIDGDLADIATQRAIRHALDAIPAWRDWAASLPPIGLVPIHIGPGLGIAENTTESRKLLVGLASRWGIVPPYAIGGTAVTEVTPRGGSAWSHSSNDCPAPPHTAGFFEPAPPMACVFACVRPHAGGGAETTVVDLDRLFASADSGDLRRWREGEWRYRTSARFGRTSHPLTILRDVGGLPFLRYRREYMEGDGLESLEALVNDPSNALVYALQRDEILVHWNGAPHGRRPQVGETPASEGERRLLLRCRIER